MLNPYSKLAYANVSNKDIDVVSRCVLYIKEQVYIIYMSTYIFLNTLHKLHIILRQDIIYINAAFGNHMRVYVCVYIDIS